MATHHPNLDFATICSGYANGLSTEDFQSLEESLLPYARLVAEQVSTQWVMDARREDMAGSVRWGDVALALIEPNIVPPKSEQPTPSPVAPTADVVELVQ